jgi:hypothetical protein
MGERIAAWAMTGLGRVVIVAAAISFLTVMTLIHGLGPLIIAVVSTAVVRAYLWLEQRGYLKPDP